jgi:N-acetylmuramoyl-L-alanine amidase
MKFKRTASPNFDIKKRPKKQIKLIVIHYTGMQSERESINRLCSPQSKVSSHYMINKGGKNYKLINDERVAWHAGKSCWGIYKNLNLNSIGIELVNKGHQFGYENFSKKQISSLIKICKYLKNKYKIKNKNIVGHSDVAPLRKIDPGEKFPWIYLAKKNIGIWHDLNLNFIKKYRSIKIKKNYEKNNFLRTLRKIGYGYIKTDNRFTSKVIKSFQRHFRKDLINGKIDKECIIIAKNLLKKS